MKFKKQITSAKLQTLQEEDHLMMVRGTYYQALREAVDYDRTNNGEKYKGFTIFYGKQDMSEPCITKKPIKGYADTYDIYHGTNHVYNRLGDYERNRQALPPQKFLELVKRAINKVIDRFKCEGGNYGVHFTKSQIKCLFRCDSEEIIEPKELFGKIVHEIKKVKAIRVFSVLGVNMPYGQLVPKNHEITLQERYCGFTLEDIADGEGIPVPGYNMVEGNINNYGPYFYQVLLYNENGHKWINGYKFFEVNA